MNSASFKFIPTGFSIRHAQGYLKTIVTSETTKAETLLYQQFARNGKGATVMTSNASELSDSKRSQSAKKTSRNPCVAKIREQNGR